MQVLESVNFVLAQRARELVAQHPHFRGRAEHFEFEYADGILRVRGRVPTFYLKQLLQVALQQLSDVRRVDCQVDVLP